MLNIINDNWDIMLNGKNVSWIHQQNVELKNADGKKCRRTKMQNGTKGKQEYVSMYVSVCIQSLLVVKIKTCIKNTTSL